MLNFPCSCQALFVAGPCLRKFKLFCAGFCKSIQGSGFLFFGGMLVEGAYKPLRYAASNYPSPSSFERRLFMHFTMVHTHIASVLGTVRTERTTVAQ